VREDALLHPYQIDDGELEALGRVRRHQRDAIAAHLGLIQVGDQGHLIQEELEGRAIPGLRVGGLEILGAGHELAQVLDAPLGFGRVLLLEVVQIARALQDQGDGPGRTLRTQGRQEPIQELQEGLDAGPRAAQAPGALRPGQSLEQGPAVFLRCLGRPFDGGLPDAPGWRVHDPAQGHPVRRVHGQPQVREHVLDLGTIIEAHTSHHDVGHVVLEELLLDGPGLGVGSIEDRVLAEGAARAAHPLEDVANHELRLVPLVPGLVDPDPIASLAIGDEPLLLAIRVVGDEGRGCVQDGPRGAVVALQAHHLRVVEVAFEVEDVADVGTPPGIDGLVRISHHAQVPVLSRKLVHEPVLHAVRVLVLVHQHVLEATSIVGQHLREALEELDGPDQQVAEVEGVGLGQQPLIGGVDLGRLLGVQVPRLLRRGRRQTPLVLPLVDAPAQAPGLVGLGVEAVPAQGLLHQGQGIGLVVDHETPGQPQVARVPTQDAHAGGVEGAHPEVVHLGAEQLPDALAHLLGGLVREGHGQDRLGRDPAHADQVGNAVGEDPGLAASGAGQHQERALGRLDGSALFGVQPREYGFGQTCSCDGRRLRRPGGVRGG
jgi:hypothetical protein